VTKSKQNKIGLLLPYRADQGLIDFVNDNLSLNKQIIFGGAQDGKNDEQLCALSKGIAPNSYADSLNDGTTVFLTHEIVLEGMQRNANRLLNEGCAAVMVCCSLPWPELEANAQIITPWAIIESAVLKLVTKDSTIGVLQPIEEAMDEEIVHWHKFAEENDLKIVSEFAAPQLPGDAHASSDDDIRSAVQSLVQQNAKIIVLDCMAYTDVHRRLVSQVSGLSVLRPMSLTGSFMAEAY